MPALVLSTLNARYAHASLGLRYLFANLDDDIRADAKIVEFVIGSKTEVLVLQLLVLNPRVVTFGVYIWNVSALHAGGERPDELRPCKAPPPWRPFSSGLQISANKSLPRPLLHGSTTVST